ncbi:hypothetical protein V6Z12_D03G055000 [Gossypium hirsutum]
MIKQDPSLYRPSPVTIHQMTNFFSVGREKEEMGETRPVPRRESPWGMPEGEHRQPKAHRCNDRAEDVIQGGTNRAIHLFAAGSPKEGGGA